MASKLDSILVADLAHGRVVLSESHSVSMMEVRSVKWTVEVKAVERAYSAVATVAGWRAA